MTKFSLVSVPAYAEIQRASLAYEVLASGAPIDVVGFVSKTGTLVAQDYEALGLTVAFARSPSVGTWEIDVTNAVVDARESGELWLGFRLQLSSLDSGPLTTGAEVQLAQVAGGTPPALLIEYSTPTQVIIADVENIQIPEGAMASAHIRLANPPETSTIVTIEKFAGDVDLILDTPSPIVFSAENYATAQEVVFRAVPDDDYLRSEATYHLVTNGAPTKQILLHEIDDEVPPARLYVRQGSTAQPMDGSGWSTAFSSLAESLALAAASGGLVREV